MKYVALVSCILFFAGCGEAPAPLPEEPAGPTVSKTAPSAETLEKLARADRLDGVEDKVVTLCPS